jgi:hypothetical protein
MWRSLLLPLLTLVVQGWNHRGRGVGGCTWCCEGRAVAQGREDPVEVSALSTLIRKVMAKEMRQLFCIDV